MTTVFSQQQQQQERLALRIGALDTKVTEAVNLAFGFYACCEHWTHVSDALRKYEEAALRRNQRSEAYQYKCLELQNHAVAAAKPWGIAMCNTGLAGFTNDLYNDTTNGRLKTRAEWRNLMIAQCIAVEAQFTLAGHMCLEMQSLMSVEHRASIKDLWATAKEALGAARHILETYP